MALKSVLDTVEGLDEAVKSHYAEVDGKFVLQVEGADALPDVANLKSAYEKVKAAREADKTALQKAKEDAAKHKADLDAALKERPDKEAVLKVRETLEKERDDWKAKAEEAGKLYLGVTRDQQLQEAIAAAGITNPSFAKAALLMHQSAVKMEGGKAVFETDMGPLGAADFMKKWASGDGKDFVTPAQGGGAKGNDDGAGHKKITGDMGGSREQRLAAIQAKISADGG